MTTRRDRSIFIGSIWGDLCVNQILRIVPDSMRLDEKGSDLTFAMGSQRKSEVFFGKSRREEFSLFL